MISHIDDYIKESNFAISHLYHGINKILAIPEIAESYYSPFYNINNGLDDQKKEKLETYLLIMEKYFEKIFSLNLLCSSLLSIANSAIELFSKNTSVPKNLSILIKESKLSKLSKYCIGPNVYGIPTGLIIYVGRSQSLHWYKNYRDIIEIVFSHLSMEFIEDSFNDLAFELDYPEKTLYSDRILLTALKWNTTEIFISGVKSIFD